MRYKDYEIKHGYDIVESSMVDDTIWNYIEIQVLQNQ